MLRFILITVFLLLPLASHAQSRLAPGEPGSVPRPGEEQAVAEEAEAELQAAPDAPVTPIPAPITPPPVVSPAPQAVSPVVPPVAVQPPVSTSSQPPVISSPPMAGTPMPATPDMTPDCMRPTQLIGQPRSAISTVQFTNSMRVLEPGSAATMDYSPNRTNIMLDAQGIVRSITCG